MKAVCVFQISDFALENFGPFAARNALVLDPRFQKAALRRLGLRPPRRNRRFKEFEICGPKPRVQASARRRYFMR
jgi:hypothetical protein